MPLTTADLNNAKEDVDHLAEIVTSAALTATDRLGNTKKTLAGVLADLTSEAALTETGQNRTAAETAQELAEAAAQEAETARELAMETIVGSYATLAAGEAAVTTAGQRFYVRQPAPWKGVYVMERTATGSKPVRVDSISRVIDYRRAIRWTLAPNVSGLLFDVWGADAWEWDGRVVPSRATTVQPTLNLVLDPFDPLDEVGTTPAREPNTTATTDNLTPATNYALKLTATAQAQQLTVNRTTYPAIPTDTYRVRVDHKLISGGASWRLGQNSSSGTLVTAGASWATTEAPLAAFNGTAFDIGIASATGNVDGVIAIQNLAVYDPLAGESSQLPTAAQELAAQKAGHMKRTLSYPGAFSLTAYGSVNIDGAAGAHMITLDPAGVLLANGYTFGGWFDCTDVPTSSQGLAFGFDAHTSLTGGASGTVHGQFGAYGAASGPSSPWRPGKMYVNPLAASIASAPVAPMHYFPGQGKQHIMLTATPNLAGGADFTLDINEVPIPLGNSSGWTAPRVARMLVGAWTTTGERRKVASPWKGNGTGLFLSPRPLTQAEKHQRGRHGIEQLRLEGDAPGLRKFLGVANGDSLSAFSPSYFWHLSDNTNLSPRLHAFNMAVGGSDIGDALAEPRKTNFLNVVRAGVDSGYDKVVVFARWGTNEVPSGDPYSWITGNYLTWRDAYYLPFVEEVKALGANVEWWHFTSANGINGPNDEASAWTYEQLFQAYNDDFRANYASYGIDRLIDIGLGTERMTGPGTFAAETIAGGRAMNNWRLHNAARWSPLVGASTGVVDGVAFKFTRTPPVGLTLSAASGAAITATAAAGTFLYHDLWRKIVAGSGGYGRIIAISSDGAQATLDTTDITPTAWPGESVDVTNRDKLTRGGGYSATSFASGAWTIQNNPEEWQNDGIHQSQFGGRLEADSIWATVQAFQDTLTGLAL